MSARDEVIASCSCASSCTCSIIASFDWGKYSISGGLLGSVTRWAAAGAGIGEYSNPSDGSGDLGLAGVDVENAIEVRAADVRLC